MVPSSLRGYGTLLQSCGGERRRCRSARLETSDVVWSCTNCDPNTILQHSRTRSCRKCTGEESADDDDGDYNRSYDAAHIAAYDSDNAGVVRTSTSTDSNAHSCYITTKQLRWYSSPPHGQALQRFQPVLSGSNLLCDNYVARAPPAREVEFPKPRLHGPGRDWRAYDVHRARYELRRPVLRVQHGSHPGYVQNVSEDRVRPQRTRIGEDPRPVVVGPRGERHVVVDVRCPYALLRGHIGADLVPVRDLRTRVQRRERLSSALSVLSPYDSNSDFGRTSVAISVHLHSRNARCALCSSSKQLYGQVTGTTPSYVIWPNVRRNCRDR